MPGIGARTAQVIVRYGRRLGGYASPQQLRECLTWPDAQAHLDEWCRDWFVADTSAVRRLDVNASDFKTLLSHPYLGYEQVRQLMRYRERHGRIPSAAILGQLDAFGEADAERLAPYLKY